MVNGGSFDQLGKLLPTNGLTMTRDGGHWVEKTMQNLAGLKNLVRRTSTPTDPKLCSSTPANALLISNERLWVYVRLANEISGEYPQPYLP